MALRTPFSEVSTTGITQLANARKAGFAISFHVLVLRNITTAIPEAIVVMFVGQMWQSHSLSALK
jgi:hypothetical protein